MLNTITQDILTIIFSYIDYDVLKIPLLSRYFKKYFDNNKDYICHKLFQNKSKYINFKHSYMVYKSLINYDIQLKYDWDRNDDDFIYDIHFEIVKSYLFDSISKLLTSNINNDIDISISIIDNILKEKEYPKDDSNFSLILFDLMEFLFTTHLGNIHKKIKILDILVNDYHIDIHEFDVYYCENCRKLISSIDIEILWHLVINNYVDLEKCFDMKNLLADTFFPYDDRIIILRDRYHVSNILRRVYNLEEFILNLINDSNVETLVYIVKNFGLDLNEPAYFNVICSGKNNNILYDLTKFDIYMFV